MSRRPIDTIRILIGITDAIAEPRVAALQLGRTPNHPEATAFRVLGIRQLVQGALAASVGFRRFGVAVDVLHLTSMVGLAVWGPRSLRRGAITQSAIATVLTVWGAVMTTKH